MTDPKQMSKADHQAIVAAVDLVIGMHLAAFRQRDKLDELLEKWEADGYDVGQYESMLIRAIE